MSQITRMLFVLLLIVFSLPAYADFFSQVTPQYDIAYSASDQFGISGVAVSKDGLIVIAATPYKTFPPIFNIGEGIGYMYQYSGGQWAQTGQFPSVIQQSLYGIGFALSKDGSTALFGDLPSSTGTYTGNVDFYAVDNGYPNVVQRAFDPTSYVGTGFGSVVAVSGNGQVAVIGAPYNSTTDIGAAYIYTYNISTSQWVAAPVLADPYGGNYDNFGEAVAVSADGSAVLIGSYAPGGIVYLYNLVSGVWAKTREFDNISTCQGCIALSADGQTAIMASLAGVAVYAASDSPAWSGTPISITDPSGMVAMSADGKGVVIGTDDNIAYLYALSGGSWTLAHTFSDPTADMADGFAGSLGYSGPSVALSDDKETVAISAGNATISGLAQAGAIYIFQSTADLSLGMTAAPTLVALNQPVTLDVTVANNDTEVTAYNVIFTDTLPAGLTYVSNSPAGGSCSSSGATVTCTLASLAPGATWQPVITVQVSTAGAYSDSASVTSNQPDTDMANNSASVSISMLTPTVSGGSFTTDQDTSANKILTGSNSCNCGTPVFSVVAPPSHGTVAITDTATGAFTYTPTAGYSGSDSFTFQLSNGIDTSGTATESITVNSGGGGGGGGSVDFFALGLLGGLLAFIRHRRTRC